MAFTKIAAPAGIDTSGSIVVNGINATGIITDNQYHCRISNL